MKKLIFCKAWAEKPTELIVMNSANESYEILDIRVTGRENMEIVYENVNTPMVISL